MPSSDPRTVVECAFSRDNCNRRRDLRRQPVEELFYHAHIGHPRVAVTDSSGEEFDEAAAGVLTASADNRQQRFEPGSVSLPTVHLTDSQPNRLEVLFGLCSASNAEHRRLCSTMNTLKILVVFLRHHDCSAPVLNLLTASRLRISIGS
jgi:hypothetical protein